MLMKFNFKTYCLINELPKIGSIKGHKIASYLRHNIDNIGQLIDLYNEVVIKEKFNKISNKIMHEVYNKVINIIESSKYNNIDAIGYDDDQYPHKFKNIHDAPLVLYSKGDVSLLNSNKNTVAIIGSRNPSTYGSKISYKVSELFSKNNYIVASGLAMGCDTQAHTSCLDNKSQTIAIMPSSLDNISPKSNTILAERIIMEGGCLLSEYHVGSSMNKFNYIARDRLQSAISNLVILIESKIDGGSMHAIKFANKYNIESYCWLHNKDYLDINLASGNIYLIKNNLAKPLKSSSDILKIIEHIEDKVDIKK